ncbi:MAG: polyprenyl synthetase family protein [Bacteroidetes bacterium]|nr:polyprenyl synthetase family protein [Bacteroidota bacterium]
MLDYTKQFQDHLQYIVQKEAPAGLYQPISYLLHLGGKRIRPILTLMATNAYHVPVERGLAAALAVELFHNFTLMHDDIMDDAPLRRGNPTVHEKWNLNTGILSGDAMLVQAYQSLEVYEDSVFSSLTRMLSQTAIEVCEGQQYDMDFETQSHVSQESYLEMIRLKTAVLVGCALKMGATVGGASNQDAQGMYDFGVLLGTAFQIQDDFLDAFGDPKVFGKQVGGDILENKKTILYHQAMSQANKADQDLILRWFSEKTPRGKAEEKIKAVKELFESSGAKTRTQSLVVQYTEAAFEKLDSLSLDSQGKSIFKKFGQNLMERKY